MQKSTIRLLVISFFISFSFVSCGIHPTKNLTVTELQQTFFDAPYFKNPEMDYVYKTTISVYGNDISGIFIIKKISSESHRVVFTTDFGNKLIDFEISETDFKINSIVDELDRKILINTLQEDFRLLLRKNFTNQKQFENSEAVVYESEGRNGSNLLFVSKSNQKLQKIVKTAKRKEKFSITFTSENNIFADKIVIDHQNIKLKIELNYLKN